MTPIQLYGCVGRAPKQRTTATTKAMVTGATVVDLGRGAEARQWFLLLTFPPASCRTHLISAPQLRYSGPRDRSGLLWYLIIMYGHFAQFSSQDAPRGTQ